jgi:hypothetical protein
MLGHRAHDPQILEGGADVVGDDVAAPEPVDDPAHGQQQRPCLRPLRIAQDYRFAAAIGQIADRRLVGHAARQAKDIGQGLVAVSVWPHPAAAERRPERGRVQRDDRPQPGRGVADERHLLVIVEVRMIEHRSPLRQRCRLSPHAVKNWLPCGSQRSSTARPRHATIRAAAWPSGRQGCGSHRGRNPEWASSAPWSSASWPASSPSS